MACCSMPQERRDLTRFVEHQRQRDWGQGGGKSHYKQFYDALYQSLQDLDRDAADFVPAGLARREQRAQTAIYAGRLAHEFIQHVVAEAEFARVVGDSERTSATPGSHGGQRKDR